MSNQNLYKPAIFAWTVFWAIFFAIFLVSVIAGTDSPWATLGIILLVTMGAMHEKVAAGIVAVLFAVNEPAPVYERSMIEYHEKRIEALTEVPWDSSRDLLYHQMALNAHMEKAGIAG